MEKIKVLVWVDPAAAVRAGKSDSGWAEMVPTEEEIAKMDPEAKEELALLLRGGPGGGEQGRPPTATVESADPKQPFGCVPSWTEVCRGLLGMRERRLKAEEEKRLKAEAEIAEAVSRVLGAPSAQDLVRKDWGRGTGQRWAVKSLGLSYGTPTAVVKAVLDNPAVAERLREAEALCAKLNAEEAEEARRQEEAVARKEAEEKRATASAEAQFEAACAAFVKDLSGPEHGYLAERYADGLLSSEELLKRIRDSVFGPLEKGARNAAGAPIRRHKKLRASDIGLCGCSKEMGEEPEAAFYTTEPEGLEPEEYGTLVGIRANAPEGATVEIQAHRVYCHSCHRNGAEEGDGETEVLTALVTVVWHGRKLSREYEL